MQVLILKGLSRFEFCFKRKAGAELPHSKESLETDLPIGDITIVKKPCLEEFWESPESRAGGCEVRRWEWTSLG